jgi:hypothetical protein
VGIAAVLILAVVGVIFGLNGRNNDPTPTIPAVAVVNTDTPQPATDEPNEPTSEPEETPDVVATAVAAIALTETAKPTNTAVPTATKMPTPTTAPTIDAAANCTYAVELVNAYAYQTQETSYAPVGVSFPMSWILRNSGTCLWPAGSQWAYADGEELGFTNAVIVENETASGDEITLTADLEAPATAGSYESIWQLSDENGEPIGGPVAFSIDAYIPTTATPTTAPVVATPTTEPADTEITELNYAFEISSCEYVGSDWRCRVRLTPYGGGGGPYTMFIFLNPIVELRDQFYYDYYVQARRCSAWNTEIKVIDEATSLEFSRHLYVDPDDYFDGGCTK